MNSFELSKLIFRQLFKKNNNYL